MLAPMNIQWSPPPPDHAAQRYKLSVDDVYAMFEAGILHPELRVELFDGELIEMASKNIRHEVHKNRLNIWLAQNVKPPFQPWVETTVRLSEHTYVEPDISIICYRGDMEKVTGADCELLIEVADTSLPHDRDRKIPTYAAHSIREYWLINTQASEIIIHRESDGEAWQDVRTVGYEVPIAPLFDPGLVVNLSEIVG